MRAAGMKLAIGLTLYASIAACSMPENSPDVGKAAAEARGLDTLRGNIISALQHNDEDGTGAAPSLEIADAEEWAVGYNAFAGSPSAGVLADYAKEQAGGSVDRDAVCPNLRPSLAIATSAEFVARAGHKIVSSPLLETCATSMCIPQHVQAIGDTCDFSPMMIPVQPS